MKLHHWIAIILAVVLVGALILWPKTHLSQQLQPADELTGSWHGGGSSTDGFEWFMEYTFKTDGTYALKTGTDFTEAGTYRISNRYLDGSIEVEKTIGEEKFVFVMVIVTTDDPDVIYLEGVQLNRIK